MEREEVLKHIGYYYVSEATKDFESRNYRGCATNLGIAYASYTLLEEVNLKKEIEMIMRGMGRLPEEIQEFVGEGVVTLNKFLDLSDEMEYLDESLLLSILSRAS